MYRRIIVLLAVFYGAFVVSLAGAVQTSFEVEMLEVLKVNGVITQQDYDRLITKLRAENQNVTQEILDLLLQKNIISSDQYASLSQKAREVHSTGVVIAQANSGTANETKVAIAEVQEEGEKQKVEIQEAADDAVQRIAQASNIELPTWVKKMKFSGDLRLRHDTQWRDEKSADGTKKDKYHRNRERLRLRFGFKMDIAENTEVGVRLASGNGFQNTTNQSFDEHARGKDIWLDRAYAKWQPKEYVTLIGGKMENPLFTTPLVWDPDVNPEGIAQKVTYEITDDLQVFGNFGQWFVEELNIKDSNSDATLLAWQLGTAYDLNNKAKFECALSYYDFLDFDSIDWQDGDLNDTETFIGYNHGHSQQMVFDDDEKLLNEFKCWELVAMFSFKDVLPVPFSVYGNYIYNADADIDRLIKKGVETPDGLSNPDDLLAYGSDDRDTGWLVGCSVGNKKKKGDWYMDYHYQELEDYAFPAVFVDSDFHGGGTNNKGHFVHGRYFLTDYIYAAATGFFTEREDESKDGKKDENRLQLDLVLKF